MLVGGEEATIRDAGAACDASQWQEALAALLKAARLDRAYQPFSLRTLRAGRIFGAGGFGTVVKCVDYPGSEEREVAVKEIYTQDLAREIQEIFAEAHIIQRLKHPAIIRVAPGVLHEDDDARPFIVMEFFDGVSLETHLKLHGKLPPQDLLAIAQQIAAALQEAHRKNIYHRDLKPDNILVRKTDKGWQVRLIDFGLAVRMQAVSNSMARPAQAAASAMRVMSAPSSSLHRNRRAKWTRSAARLRMSGPIPTFTRSARPVARPCSATTSREVGTTRPCRRRFGRCNSCWTTDRQAGQPSSAALRGGNQDSGRSRPGEGRGPAQGGNLAVSDLSDGPGASPTASSPTRTRRL